MRNWVLRGSYCKVHMKIAQRLSEACRYLVLFNCVDKLDNCLLQWDGGKCFPFFIHVFIPTSVEHFYIQIMIVNV